MRFDRIGKWAKFFTFGILFLLLLFVAVDRGLQLISTTKANIQRGAPSNKVRSLFVGPTGKLYAGTNAGVYSYDGNWLYMSETSKYGLVNAIYETKEALFLGTDAENKPGLKGGLWRLQNGTWSHDFNETVFSFYNDPERGLIAATWSGVKVYVRGSWHDLYTQEKLHYSDHIHSFARLGSYDCLGTVNQGIICINVDTNERQILSSNGVTETYLANNSVRVMTQRKDEPTNVYVGTDGNGIDVVSASHYPPSITSGFTPAIAKRVMDFVVDSHNHMWLATLDGGTLYGPFEKPWISLDKTPAYKIVFYKDVVVSATDHGVKVFDLPPQ